MPVASLACAATPEQIGIRDGRRIKGRYFMTSEDLVNGKRQADAVVRATFPVDIHVITAADNTTAAYSNAGVRTQPCDIPLRALIAHASYRVTGNAIAMGEAAGATAAVAASRATPPHDVPWSEVQAAIATARS